jgi:pyruvate/2-oxoglutarate dehydrogenase complex dihydrolipoamide dehydrogenase (E3) component
LVASADAAHLARRAADFGVVINGQVGVDMKKVKARKDAVSGQSQKNVESWLKQLQNCTVYQGHARFTSPTEMSVGNNAANGDAHIHQCWGACSNASNARA